MGNTSGIIIRKCCHGPLCNNHDKSKIFKIFIQSVSKISKKRTNEAQKQNLTLFVSNLSIKLEIRLLWIFLHFIYILRF